MGSLEGQSELRADTLGARAGLGIDIEVGRLEVREGGVISANANEGSTGNAGSLTVKANDVDVRNGGGIETLSFSNGAAGDISIMTERLKLANSEITSRSGFGSGQACRGMGGSFAMESVADFVWNTQVKQGISLWSLLIRYC